VTLDEEEFSSANPGWTGDMNKENAAKMTNILNTALIKSCMIFISKGLMVNLICSMSPG
jgi:hypothetical protein